MGALDELLRAWRANPDAESTVALATYLGVSGREELIREVGGNAETWHQNDGAVMLAIGRMYLDGGLMPEAQQALVAAGRADARDGRPFRYLGEVLLRRGDAMRAEKVLARAVQLGQGDSETRLWHDRSVVYVALQKRVGPQAVAAEVERTLPRKLSIPPPTIQPFAVGSLSEEETTANRKQARGRTLPLPAAEMFPPEPPTAPAASALEGMSEITTVQAQPASWMPAPAPSYNAQRPPMPAISQPTPMGGFAPPPLPAAPGRLPPPPVAPPPGVPFGGPPNYQPSTLGLGQTQRLAAQRPPSRQRPMDPAFPGPELVLEHLARAGIYEVSGGAPPAWEQVKATKARGSWVLILAILLLVTGGAGAYTYARRVKQQRTVQAQELTEEVAKLMQSSNIEDLRASDGKLSTVFDLDSRNKRAARLWLENRVLSALLLTDEPRGIDSAVHRALTVGLSEEDVAFGRIAAFLVEGDLAGAAGLLPRWDGKVSKDAYYQLAAAAALERAGDPRAVERYQAARKLAPNLVAAEILLARLMLLELGPEQAKPLIDGLKQKLGDRPEVRALRALSWAVDSARPEAMPPDALIAAADRDKLPSPLRAVPHISEAVQAMTAHEHKRASTEIAASIGFSTTPALATRLGFLAIQAGDEQLARRAALRALQFTAVYPGARVLAARVALLGGRLDEAKKAIEELDPQAPDILVVRAVIAYEALDPSELSAANEGLGEGLKSREDLLGLSVAPGVLAGRSYSDTGKLTKMAEPSVAWGEVVAVDAALDSGNLELAQTLVGKWGDTARPPYLLRASRLRRYQGKLDEAERASKRALDQGTTTARVLIERIYVLVAREDAAAARALIAKYPTLIGPMTGWLGVLVDVAAKRKADAAVKASQLEPPPDAAPLLLRVMVARALAAAGDKRAGPYLKSLRGYARHGDVIRAAQEL